MQKKHVHVDALNAVLVFCLMRLAHGEGKCYDKGYQKVHKKREMKNKVGIGRRERGRRQEKTKEWITTWKEKHQQILGSSYTYSVKTKKLMCQYSHSYH